MTARTPEATWLYHSWLALLIVAINGFSFVFACAIPFPAFVVLVAMTLPRTDATRLTIALWLANQVVGYAGLGYPRTVNSVVWGLVMGATALLTTFVALRITSRLAAAGGLTQAVAALGGAFAVYEAVLLAFAVAGLGGASAFAAPIVARILVVNAVALAGLYALHRIGTALGVSRPAVSPAAPPRPVSS
jgi:hypothetical protein